MPIRKDARLHMERVKVLGPDKLNPGDIVSSLPGLWSNIGLVCAFREQKYVLFFDIQPRQGGSYESLIPLSSNYIERFFVVPGAVIVPLIDSDTFDTGHPGKNGLAIVEEKLACVGWARSSYFLFDVQDGSLIDRSVKYPVYISSWDVLAKNIDDSVVSLLEVRPD